MKNLVFCVFVLIIIYSCNSKIVYDKSLSIDNTEWHYEDIKSFGFNIADTSKVYDLILIPKHSTSFSYENLYVDIETIFPDGKKTSNSVSLNLTNDKGQWVGDCSGGYCSPKIVLLKDSRYLNGTYVLNISQYSRFESIAGVKSLNLIIEESNSRAN